MVKWTILLTCFLGLGRVLPCVLAQDSPVVTGAKSFIEILQTIELGDSLQRIAPLRVLTGDELIAKLQLEHPAIVEYKPAQQVTQQFQYGSVGQKMELSAWYFPQPLDAFGAFSTMYPEISENIALTVYQPVPSLFAYWASPTRQHIWRGHMLLILSSEIAEPEMAQAFSQLNEKLLAQLPETDKMPPVLMILPTRGLLLESLRWRNEPDFTPENIGRVLTGIYGRNRPGNIVETECHFVIVQYENAAIASEQFKSAWLRKFSEQDKPLSLSSIGQNSFWLYSAKYGLVSVMQQGRFIIALRHVVDLQRGEAFLRIIAREIRRLPKNLLNTSQETTTPQ